jgi:hypothetical protein
MLVVRKGDFNMAYRNNRIARRGFRTNSVPCKNPIFPIPTYKTRGIKNPSYKNANFYFANRMGRALNCKLVENYWTTFLLQGVSANTNENLRSYYDNIVSYMRAMYLHLHDKYELTYSNLSVECSVVLVIKRCLRNIFSESEVSKLILLLKLTNSCECLGE